MAPVAHVDEWTDDCASVAEIEQALIELRLRRGFEEKRNLRTSVLTHLAWVPPEWQQAATATLAGLAERHPSRTLLLFPQPEAEDGLAARALLEPRPPGARALAPASIALPLVLPDLPVFLRWRGRPDFGGATFVQLADMVDRLVVDSAEWPDLPSAYAELVGVFDQVAVSDIAWRRTLPWREALAGAWPDLPERVTGPRAEATLVAGWLSSRAGAKVVVETAENLPVGEADDPSELLSAELDVYVRDPVYEEAVKSAGLL